MSKQKADLLNLSFMTGVFPFVQKTTEVVPVFRTNSKLDYSNYHPISMFSTIEETLEKLIYRRFYTFLDKSNVIYNLQFGFRQLSFTSHVLINITRNLRKAFDKGNIDYDVFYKKILTLLTTR